MRLFLSLLATWALLIQGSLSRHLSMLDIQDFVDQLGDEILSHDGLRTPSNPLAGGMHNLGDSVEGDIVSEMNFALTDFFKLNSRKEIFVTNITADFKGRRSGR